MGQSESKERDLKEQKKDFRSKVLKNREKNRSKRRE
jgi:hypothetical protein